jgi:hypothetical protein
VRAHRHDREPGHLITVTTSDMRSSAEGRLAAHGARQKRMVRHDVARYE